MTLEVAHRLVIYLSSIGRLSPALTTSSDSGWAAALQVQYTALGVDERKLARETGRQLIREFGSIAGAIASFPNLQQILMVIPSPAPPRIRTWKERFLRKISRWSPLTPPCPKCRMVGGCFPKQSYPSRAWAQEVWARQHDRDTLRLYECPAQPGFFHLGHVRRHIALVVPQEPPSSSIPLRQSPAILSTTGGHA